MLPDEQDHVAAARMGHDADPADWSSRPLNVAGAAFLAAVERIDGEGFVRWKDTSYDDGEAYLMRTTRNVHLVLESEGDRVPHVLTADEAELRGWELIALAHQARKAG